MALEFDNKISLGHLMTLGVLVAGGLFGYSDLRSQQAQTAIEVAQLSRNSNERELRIRAVEIGQASQISDLRSIQVGITEIKNALGRLGVQP